MAKIDNSGRVGPRRPAPRRRKTSGGRGRSVRAVDTVALMDSLRIEKPILAGFDWGARFTVGGTDGHRESHDQITAHRDHSLAAFGPQRGDDIGRACRAPGMCRNSGRGLDPHPWQGPAPQRLALSCLQRILASLWPRISQRRLASRRRRRDQQSAGMGAGRFNLAQNPSTIVEVMCRALVGRAA